MQEFGADTHQTANRASNNGAGNNPPPRASKGVIRAAIVLAVALLIMAAAAAVGGVLLLSSPADARLAPAAFVASSFFFIAGVVIPLGMVREGALETEANQNYQNDYDAFKQPLKEIGQPTIAGLTLANFQQMRAFTVIAQRQARMAFYASLIGAGLSLFVLIAGATVAISSTGTASKVAAASLAVLGTALSGFLARVFLKTYQMTMRQMSYYYGQPLVHCYLLHAEWLTLMSMDRSVQGQEFKLWKEVIEASIEASVNAQNHLLTMSEPGPGRKKPAAGKARGNRVRPKAHHDARPKPPSPQAVTPPQAASVPGQAAPSSR